MGHGACCRRRAAPGNPAARAGHGRGTLRAPLPSPLELQRARKRLEHFCRQRNRPGSGLPQWYLSRHDSGFVINEHPAGQPGGEAVPLLRLSFEEDCWRVAVPAAAGGWQPYPPLPRARSIEAVIDELERAPLHVHWG